MLNVKAPVRMMLAIVIAILIGGIAEAGNLVVNGDFEDLEGWGLPGTLDCPAGWTSGGTSRKNPAGMQTGTAALGGSGTSAYMEGLFTAENALRRQIGQCFDEPTGAEWTFSLDLACENAGSWTDRSLQLILQPEDGTRLMFRVTGADSGNRGDVEFYRGSQGSWTTIPGLEESVLFSTDLANAPQSHHLTMTAHFDQTSPTWDFSVTDSLGTTRTATGMAWFESGSAPDQGSGLGYFLVPTYNSNGDFVMDNVSVMGASATELIVNGDFEDTTGWGDIGTQEVPAGWMLEPALRKNPAAQQTGTEAIGGSGTSAYLPEFFSSKQWLQRQMIQYLENPSSADWTLEMDLACTNSNDPELRVWNHYLLRGVRGISVARKGIFV